VPESLQWISFWIAPEAAPARVTLGVTSLLTLSTQHAKSQAGLPPVSYLKAVDLFMSVCTMYVRLYLPNQSRITLLISKRVLYLCPRPVPPLSKYGSTGQFENPHCGIDSRSINQSYICIPIFMSRFVFLALMEYCLVNIVLGDSYDQKTRRRLGKPKSSIYHLRMSRRIGSSSSRNSPRQSTSSTLIVCIHS